MINENSRKWWELAGLSIASLLVYLDFAKELHWFKKWRRVLKWNAPYSQLFVGGEYNVSYNCLNRHLSTPRKNKAATIWEGESRVYMLSQ